MNYQRFYICHNGEKRENFKLVNEGLGVRGSAIDCQAATDVPSIEESESIGSVFTIAEDVRGRLINRYCSGVGDWILHFSN